MEKSDRVGVKALVWIFPYSFDGAEDQVRSQSEKALYADIADLGRVAGDPVVDRADFNNRKMPAGTGLWLIGLVNADQNSTP